MAFRWLNELLSKSAIFGLFIPFLSKFSVKSAFPSTPLFDPSLGVAQDEGTGCHPAEEEQYDTLNGNVHTVLVVGQEFELPEGNDHRCRGQN